MSHCAALPDIVCSFASASDAPDPKFTLMPVFLLERFGKILGQVVIQRTAVARDIQRLALRLRDAVHGEGQRCRQRRPDRHNATRHAAISAIHSGGYA